MYWITQDSNKQYTVWRFKPRFIVNRENSDYYWWSKHGRYGEAIAIFREYNKLPFVFPKLKRGEIRKISSIATFIDWKYK